LLGTVSARRPPRAKVEAKSALTPAVKAGDVSADNTGNGVDFFAQVSGALSTATGSFPSVLGATAESDQAGANAYSVQLNSNGFSNATTAALCRQSSSPQSQCVGWQQAVYSSIVGQAGFYIQYWLLDFGSDDCPDGWTSRNGSCSMNTVSVRGVPTDVLNGFTPVPVSDLGSMSMSMTAGSSDLITITINATAWAAQFPSVLGLNSGNSWNLAEFGVYGDGSLDTAQFASNTSLAVNIATQSVTPTTAAPTCATSTSVATGEQNNLSFPDFPYCCLATGGDSPSVTFQESNVPGQACTVCGGQGQSCCNANNGAWCASDSNICLGNTCQACGGTNQPCCANSQYIQCSHAGDTCQLGFCGAPSGLAASPTSLTVQEGDGTVPSNVASTTIAATGYWARSGVDSLAVSYQIVGAPPGVSIPGPNHMPPGMSFAYALSEYGIPTVQITAGDSTTAGTYEIALTGTLALETVTDPTPLTVVVGACQPLTCAAAGYACGSLDNLCGATQQCGSCASGQHCIAGGCYNCAERSCPSPEFWNPATCACESCPCGTITHDGKLICNVCKPG
jgi:hypothetical protein